MWGYGVVCHSRHEEEVEEPARASSGGPQDSVGSTLPRSPSFIQMPSDDSSQVQVMIKIIQGFGWHEVVVLRQDTKYHKRFALSLEDAFAGAKIKIISMVSLSNSTKDLEIAQELDKLKTMQTRVFLVYMVPLLRSRVLVLAKTAGIMKEGYTWLIMDSLSYTSKSFQYNNNLDYEEVVLPRRDSPPRLNGHTHFKSDCEKLSSWIKSEKASDEVIPKWKVYIPKKDGFTEFVNVNKKTCKLTGGFSIEVFCAALLIFPYKVEPDFVPFVDRNCEASQNYNDILQQIRLQAYAANLSSIFTVDQLRPVEPRVIQSVGYQEGSFVRDLLASQYHNVTLKQYTTIKQYHEALMNKSVDVIYDELPYAFPLGSPYVPEFSRAVVKVSESKKMQDLMKKYHVHDYSSDDQASQVPQKTPPLDAHRFIGLFILAGVGTIGAVLASEYALWQRHSATLEMTNVSEDLLNVDNQEHPQPVFIPGDGEIPINEFDEVEEIAEVPLPKRCRIENH
ncbi:hypothetical protein RJ640_012627 [Escallonia rubra]|uniref:Ionotropic glutamate receptor C-terminal domain-containing protein n=1 Tax=Escallonia rubra TaxID=112253 RepID=A0AA88QJ87_9ASTE|nr:hypothetical protein RJ640_012627 [Escallonia rubra]